MFFRIAKSRTCNSTDRAGSGRGVIIAAKPVEPTLQNEIDQLLVSLRNEISAHSETFAPIRTMLLSFAATIESSGQFDPSKICGYIKKLLKDEIKAAKITSRWIEKVLPPRYKRKYNPKSERDSHLSRNPSANSDESPDNLSPGEIHSRFMGSQGACVPGQVQDPVLPEQIEFKIEFNLLRDFVEAHENYHNEVVHISVLWDKQNRELVSFTINDRGGV